MAMKTSIIFIPTVERVLIKPAVIYFCCKQLRAEIVVKKHGLEEMNLPWQYIHKDTISGVQSLLWSTFAKEQSTASSAGSVDNTILELLLTRKCVIP